MSSSNQSPKQRKRTRSQIQTIEKAPAIEVPANRHAEIRRYLDLFGYKPERSILQVHVAGSFGQARPRPRELASRERAAARYQGRTFTVLGRTHDPTFIKRLIPPKTRRGEERNRGYLGYLWKERDEDEKAPDELIPLDFVPASLRYPRDWKDIFRTPGYLVTMHVPSDFAKYKNEIHNRLRRIRGDVDVKNEWKFLDELSDYGYSARISETGEEEDRNKSLSALKKE